MCSVAHGLAARCGADPIQSRRNGSAGRMATLPGFGQSALVARSDDVTNLSVALTPPPSQSLLDESVRASAMSVTRFVHLAPGSPTTLPSIESPPCAAVCDACAGGRGGCVSGQLAAGGRFRGGSQQSLCIGVLRVGHNPSHRTLFDNFARPHHDHMVTEQRNDVQVVADE